jgi:hypothetical protein
VLAPPGVGHGRTTQGPAQRGEGAKHRPRERGKQNRATNSSIKAEAPPRSANIAGGGRLHPRVLCAAKTALFNNGP